MCFSLNPICFNVSLPVLTLVPNEGEAQGQGHTPRSGCRGSLGYSKVSEVLGSPPRLCQPTRGFGNQKHPANVHGALLLTQLPGSFLSCSMCRSLNVTLRSEEASGSQCLQRETFCVWPQPQRTWSPGSHGAGLLEDTQAAGAPMITKSFVPQTFVEGPCCRLSGAPLQK